MDKLPNKRATTAAQADPNWRINTMEVNIEGPAHLYANGRQQVKIVLGVAAQVNAQPVRLTQTERDNVRVVMYRNDTQVLPFNTFERGLSVSRTHGGYDYFQSPNVRTRQQQQGADEYLEFYFSCRPDILDGPVIRLGFMVTGDNGRRFCTNGNAWNANGTPDLTFKPDTDSLDITYEPEKTYPLANFQLSELADFPVSAKASGIFKRWWTWLVPSAKSPGIFNRWCTLSIQTGATDKLRFRDMVIEPRGMIAWDTPLPSDRLASFTGYTKPGERTILWNENASQVPVDPGVPRPAQVPSATAGVPTLVLCGRLDIPKPATPYTQPCAITLTDTAGNEHRLAVRFVPGNRVALELIAG